MKRSAVLQLVQGAWSWIEPRLIPNWRRAPRMASMLCWTAAGALQGAWLFVPDDLKAYIGPEAGRWIGYAVFILAAIGTGGRMVRQNSCRHPNEARP